jgi:hypothetical protein
MADYIRTMVVLTPVAAESSVREILAGTGDIGDVRVVVLAEGASPSWRDLVEPPDASGTAGSEGRLDWVIVHEPAFAVVPPELFTRLWDRIEAGDCDAAIPVRPVTDTLKRVDESGRIVATVDRDGHRMLCTPQLYRARVLPGSPVSPGPVALPWTASDGTVEDGPASQAMPPEPATGVGAGTEALVAEIRVSSAGRLGLVEAPAGLRPVNSALG